MSDDNYADSIETGDSRYITCNTISQLGKKVCNQSKIEFNSSKDSDTCQKMCQSNNQCDSAIFGSFTTTKGTNSFCIQLKNPGQQWYRTDNDIWFAKDKNCSVQYLPNGRLDGYQYSQTLRNQTMDKCISTCTLSKDACDMIRYSKDSKECAYYQKK